MNTLYIGDRVRWFTHETGEIQGFDFPLVKILTDEGKNKQIHISWLTKEQEVVKEMKKDTFKVGDMVKLVNASGLKDRQEGEIGKVVSPDRHNLIEVKFVRDGKYRKYYSSRFEKFILSLEKGDIVELLAGVGGEPKGTQVILDAVMGSDGFARGPQKELLMFAVNSVKKIGRLKKGDKVIVAHKVIFNDLREGTMATVKEVWSNEVYLEEDSSTYYLYSQLLPVPKNHYIGPQEIGYLTEGFDSNGYRLGMKVDRVVYKDNTTTLYYTAPYSGKKGKVVAKCHPDDTFDANIGYEVACLKALQESIPCIIKTLTDNRTVLENRRKLV